MFAAIPFYDRSQVGASRKLFSGNNDMFFPNSSSIPAPAPTHDADSKGIGPLVSLGEYTVASQLADSRAPSPRPDSNAEDSYDDPVKLGILPEDAVIGLFFSFHTVLNPVIALLDPTLHTPIYVRRRSKVLYTAILAAACRFFKPSHYKPVHDFAQFLLGRALADGVSSVEYIQALSIMIYWKEADDGSMWRKLGLAIRMAFELNLHHMKSEPLPLDELQARERLNEERTWFQLICHDWTMALQRGKPRMIPEEHFPREGLRWLRNHAKFPCNADVTIVTSLEMVSHYSLFQSIRSTATTHNRIQLEPFIRHVIGGGEKFLDTWPLETLDPNLSPISLSFLRYYQMRMRLALCELKLVLSYNPLPGSSHILMLDCVNAALAILRHIITDFAPNGYLSYGQDFIPFATAYAGTWLFKQLARFDEQLRETTLETFRALSTACKVQAQITGNNTLYYSKFFDHLLKHAPAPNTNGVTTQLPSHTVATRDGMHTDLVHMSTVLPQVPPLEDMDTTWFFAVDGLKHWGHDFSYNAQFM